MNLVTNAAEAIGDENGLVTLATGIQEINEEYRRNIDLQNDVSDGTYAFFEVSDNGCGMDEKTLARLFDPFFTTKFQGRGLGLAAVLGIVRGHDGAIKVYSEAGRGTSIKVMLPTSDGVVESRGETPSGFDGNARLEGTALVVDDEEAVRNLATRMLERRGLHVLTACDGVEALEIFRERHEDIVIVLLDMTMPRMNGEETFRALRAIDPSVKVVLSSGYNEQDATSRFVGKGLTGFIRKPFTLNDFDFMLARTLRPREEL